MTLNDQDLKDFENIERWILVSSLQGVPMAELWNSDDDDVGTALELLDEIEQHNERMAKHDVTVKVALSAVNMGITTDQLWRYHSRQEQLAELEQVRRNQEEEKTNERLVTLREVHKFEFVESHSHKQVHWQFEADLGHGGTFKYLARKVQVSWLRNRYWLEWRDASGKKQRINEDLRSQYWAMDESWPSAWQKNYGRYFSDSQMPYAYTARKISDARAAEQMRVLKAQKRASRKAKTTV